MKHPSTKRDRFDRRWNPFSLSAQRTGGAGRGENFPNDSRFEPRNRSAAVSPTSRSRLAVAATGFQQSRAPVPGEVGFNLPFRLCFLGFLLLTLCVPNSFAAQTELILNPDSFAHYARHFNAMEDENVTNAISNAESWSWLQKEIPLFACPDREVEEMYYFRWWSFRKHVVQTPDGFVFTEFLTPAAWAGDYNTIACAAGFHLMEGRWVHDQRYVQDYIRFWLRGQHGKPQPKFHKFSSWFAAAVYDCYLVNHDRKFTVGILNDLVADYRAWEKEHQTTNGLFWQYDVRDGMEESISGSRTVQNLRPTINSYMFGNARAIAAIARLAGKPKIAAEFAAKADDLRKRVETDLWNEQSQFFEVRHPNGELSDVREEIGFIPWMFGLPDDSSRYDAAWQQLTNAQGFSAPYGVTTAERRSPQFRSHGYGHCEWDGAVWPFATSQTLAGLANLLRNDRQSFISRRDYYDAFLTYVHSQHAAGKPYLGEYLDETTGQWINGKNGRSRYYNHSLFADLLISGVVGLVPRADNLVEVSPLLPENVWNWFCLDGVNYHGHRLTIIWDQDGRHYGRGSGLLVFADGKQIARSHTLTRVTGELP
jgi:hypothetical protein